MPKKLTQEEFEEKLKKVHGEEIECLGKYEGNKIKIVFKHNICGHIWEAAPSNILQGYGCPKCGGTKFKTNEDFFKELQQITTTIIPLEKYKNGHTPIKCKCTVCNHEWQSRPSDLLRNHGCPKCARKEVAKKQTKSHEDFLKELNETHNREIECLEEYKGNKIKIAFKHNICGHIWEATPDSILKGTSCPKCTGKMKKTHKDFLEELNEMYNGGVECLEEYINNKTKISFKHTICGHKWKARPGNVLQGHGCPKCAGIALKSHEDFLKELNEIHNGEIECLGKYINAYTKILFKHTTCGHEWKTKPNTIQRCGCPKCNQSKGEKYIQRCLDNYNIDFQIQYRISECRNVHSLPFDFAIFDGDNNLVFLLEYDGQQHFEPIETFGGEETFQKQQIHDKIKDDYCEENDIPLERIAYFDWETEEDIEKIVVEILKKYGLT